MAETAARTDLFVGKQTGPVYRSITPRRYRGLQRLYVLFVMEVATRQVHILATARIRRRKVLGVLINEYERAA